MCSSDLSELSSIAADNLADLAASLAEYPNTDVVIAGHTDATGSDEYNLALSERRAEAAAIYLLQNGIPAERLSTVGYGESQPIADNESALGRQQNRRVEVAIYASDDYRAELEAQQNN